MIANRYKAVIEWFSHTDRDREEHLDDVLARNYSHMTTLEDYNLAGQDLLAAVDEVLRDGNDIEGAAIGIAAVDQTYPDSDADEYFEARDRVLSQRCLLWRLYGEPGFSESDLEYKVEEMLAIIQDGAERIAAGFPLAA
jgi:hypothetical protein